MVAASAALFVYVIVLLSKSRRRYFAADDGSVSGDGHSFRCCTVGELLRDWDCVSVMGVREKCDEKGLGAASGHRNARCRQFGRAPFGYRSGQAFSKSAGRGEPPADLEIHMLEC